MRHGTCFRRRLATHHAGAAPHSAVAELGVVRRFLACPVKLDYPEPVYYRKPLPEERLDELLSVPWFSSIGTPSIAAASALSPEWADFRLERRNDLTGLLATRLQQRGSEWNPCAKAFGAFYDSYLAATVSAALIPAGLPDALAPIVRWDIVSYMQELNYSDVRRPSFFHSLWELYRIGHFPCGWDGIYPAGSLQFQ